MDMLSKNKNILSHLNFTLMFCEGPSIRFLKSYIIMREDPTVRLLIARNLYDPGKNLILGTFYYPQF
jgi:hypothetical protein